MIIERISNFRVVRTVSEGEKNALLHAVSEKSGERVAIRLFRGSTATEEIEQRSQRSVRVTQLLSHPAVVRIMQTGRLPDGTVYQVQEQLSGETLASRLAARPRLPQNELLRLGRQIATVLAAAHARGVVHRALRPESLQLVPDPEAIGGERVKITDWGLSQLPAQDGQPTEELPPVPLDEPTYLSPEQCRAGSAAAASLPGPAAPADPAAVADRIDVYALGVLLFQMATGQPPFAGHSASEVIALHIAALPPKLEQKGVVAPPELPALLAAMLIKDPTARPTMLEVEARLQQLAAQQQLAKTMLPPTVAASAPLPAIQPNGNVTVQLRVSPKPTPRPRRWLWAAGAAALGLTLAGLGLALSSRSSSEKTSSRAESASPHEAASEPNTAAGTPTPSANPGGTAPAEPAAAPAAAGAAVPAATPQPAETTKAAAASAETTKPAAASAETTKAAAASAETTKPAAASAETTRAAAASAETTKSAAAAAPAETQAPAPTAAPAAASAATDDAPRPAAAPVIAGTPAALEGLGPEPTVAAGPKGSAAIVAGAAPAVDDTSPTAVAAAARAKTLLMSAQSAFDRGDYPETIVLANQALPLDPKAAAVVLGKTGCTIGDLALVNRSYATLRKSPAQLSLLLAECRKYSIVLGAHGQFGHKGR